MPMFCWIVCIHTLNMTIFVAKYAPIVMVSQAYHRLMCLFYGCLLYDCLLDCQSFIIVCFIAVCFIVVCFIFGAVFMDR